jgi:hypothetical protein
MSHCPVRSGGFSVKTNGMPTETRRPFCTSCGGLLMLSEDDLREFYEELLKDSQKRRDSNNETKQKLINRQIDLLQEMILNQNKLWKL